VEYVSSGGKQIDWAEAAYHSFRYIPVLADNESLSAFGEPLYGALCVGTTFRPDHTVMDIAPTVCEALGIPCEGFDGRSLLHVNASRIVVIYVDALSWYRYLWASRDMKNISSLGTPVLATSVYPSISNVNAAAMLTGVWPEKSGIDVWENRTMLVDTVFDRAKKQGVSYAWVDGPRPPVSLKDGIIRTPPYNNNRYDDAVMNRAIAEYRNGTRLLYVHIFWTDQALHSTGPYSSESLVAIRNADMLVGRMLNNIMPGTLVMVVSDHGGHDVEGGRGDHGTLLPQDMLVPIFMRVY